MGRKKSNAPKEVRLLTNEQIDSLLKQDVFDNKMYHQHLEQTSKELGIDKEVVEGVLTSFLSDVMKEINKYRKKITIINIYGFAQLKLMKGKTFRKK